MIVFHALVQLTGRRLRTAERGQTLAEYSLLLSFIALALVLVLIAFGPFVADLYQSFIDEMP